MNHGSFAQISYTPLPLLRAGRLSRWRPALSYRVVAWASDSRVRCDGAQVSGDAAQLGFAALILASLPTMDFFCETLLTRRCTSRRKSSRSLSFSSPPSTLNPSPRLGHYTAAKKRPVYSQETGNLRLSASTTAESSQEKKTASLYKQRPRATVPHFTASPRKDRRKEACPGQYQKRYVQIRTLILFLFLCQSRSPTCMIISFCPPPSPCPSFLFLEFLPWCF